MGNRGRNVEACVFLFSASGTRILTWPFLSSKLPQEWIVVLLLLWRLILSGKVFVPSFAVRVRHTIPSSLPAYCYTRLQTCPSCRDTRLITFVDTSSLKLDLENHGVVWSLCIFYHYGWDVEVVLVIVRISTCFYFWNTFPFASNSESWISFRRRHTHVCPMNRIGHALERRPHLLLPSTCE